MLRAAAGILRAGESAVPEVQIAGEIDLVA